MSEEKNKTEQEHQLSQKKSVLDDPPILKKGDIAKLIGCSEKKIDWLLRHNLAPRSFKIGKSRQSHIRFRLSDVEAWIEENMR